MRDYNLCYPAILTNTLVPRPSLSSILQNQLGVALDALTARMKCDPKFATSPIFIDDKDYEFSVDQELITLV